MLGCLIFRGSDFGGEKTSLNSDVIRNRLFLVLHILFCSCCHHNWRRSRAFLLLAPQTSLVVGHALFGYAPTVASRLHQRASGGQKHSLRMGQTGLAVVQKEKATSRFFNCAKNLDPVALSPPLRYGSGRITRILRFGSCRTSPKFP